MFKKLVCISLLLVFVIEATGCGTILYPKRKGQIDGEIDAGVAILDGIGLLFFIIPGVIAFAVDFSNGTIYLPHGHRHNEKIFKDDFVMNDMDRIRLPDGRTDQLAIKAAIENYVGHPVDMAQVQVTSAEQLRSHPQLALQQ